jgi:hypothetical protein
MSRRSCCGVAAALGVIAVTACGSRNIADDSVTLGSGARAGAATNSDRTRGGVGGVGSGSWGGYGGVGGIGGAGAIDGSGAVGGVGGVSTGGASGVGGAAGGGTGGGSTGGAAGSATGGTGGTTGGAGGTGGGIGTSAFFDDFESGTADQWVAVPADGWSIAADGSNVYKQSTLDSVWRVSAAGDIGWTDQVVEAKVKVLGFQGSSSAYLAAVYARFKDLNNHYYVSIDSYLAIQIRKKSAGNNISITSGAPTPAVLNTWYTIKLEVIGYSLKAYVDGTPVLVATDADIASGGVAVGTSNASAEFDDVRVTLP